jgi:ABC-type sugar transport system ATPase subunit
VSDGQRGADVHLEVRGITKHFGGVQALNDVSLTISRGTVHALVGENGAGKSTLGKVISGVVSPDEGELLVGGERVAYRSPHDALRDGITMIAQELALVPTRTVVENIFLGVESNRGGVVQPRSMRKRYASLCEEVGFEVPPNATVSSLPIGEQQKVEILRAIAREAKVIVMDEPTAALDIDETNRLLEAIKGLRRRGTTIVYVSHFLSEVLELADTVTVLREGKHVRTAPASEQTPEQLVTAMLGRKFDVVFPAKAYPKGDAPVVLSVKNLSSPPRVRDVSFEVRAGEIVGLAGLIGSGRSEACQAIFGARPAEAGAIALNGRPFSPQSPREAVRNGVAMLPEDRKGQGLHMSRTVTENITLPHLDHVSRLGVMSRGRERSSAGALRKRLDVRARRGGATRVATLSGGNQQKVLFAKWLYSSPQVLITDEPTRGVDIGAKAAIYELIHGLAEKGTAVVVISSEVEEILGLAHRVFVLREGQTVSELDTRDSSEDDVVHAAFGTQAVAL